jgi:hypothetical protein
MEASAKRNQIHGSRNERGGFRAFKVPLANELQRTVDDRFDKVALGEPYKVKQRAPESMSHLFRRPCWLQRLATDAAASEWADGASGRAQWRRGGRERRIGWVETEEGRHERARGKLRCLHVFVGQLFQLGQARSYHRRQSEA